MYVLEFVSLTFAAQGFVHGGNGALIAWNFTGRVDDDILCTSRQWRSRTESPRGGDRRYAPSDRVPAPTSVAVAKGHHAKGHQDMVTAHQAVDCTDPITDVATKGAW